MSQQVRSQGSSHSQNSHFRRGSSSPSSNSRRSSNFDDSQPPSALLHTEEIYNDDYRPSRLASQGL